MKIFWSPLAAQRIEEIHQFIANDDAETAGKIVRKIFKKIESLPQNPQRGRIVPEANREDIREVFVKEYRIIYRIDQNEIFILTLRHFKLLLPEKDVE